ncbi:Protein phosphatase 2C [Legionella nautarum]|uniref:Protein phosphatase 2C n=1 Tax=Legionella nautarum TaxID=45070 RepID=A0A0W0WTX6_9GAMM|nr:hypothetical protein [Legionella nautarum]KTD35749.1 Protein phosphatase 2C [Legionella nautarum]
MTKIISIPTKTSESSGANKEFKFGYHEIQNRRSSQEDALAWQILSSEELTPQGETKLTPPEIAHRLWTCHRLLDEQGKNQDSGTTASTTVYDGNGNLITATLADSSAFLVFYDQADKPLGVRRLNSVIHRPDQKKEKQRIQEEGGLIHKGRVAHPEVNPQVLSLAVSRAIGDKFYKEAGVCANSSLDIVNIAQAAEELEIDPENIGKIQVISVCDGFTDAAEQQTKEGHENILLSFLGDRHCRKKTGVELARLLVKKAQCHTEDNISVAVQDVDETTPPFLLGLYDGHGSQRMSTFVAKKIGELFTQQCALSRRAYAKQNLSVKNNETVYRADNPDSFEIEGAAEEDSDDYLARLEDASSEAEEKEYQPIVLKLFALTKKYKKNLDRESPQGKKIDPILDQLLTILANPIITDKMKIQAFYDYLSCRHTTDELKNIEVIEQDENRSASKFIFGVIFIIVSLVTLILPSILVSGLVYWATDRSPFDLFNTEGEQYIKEVALVEKQYLKNYSSFFNSAPSTEEEDTTNTSGLDFTY